MQTKNTHSRRLSIGLATTMVVILLQANAQALNLGSGMLKRQTVLTLPADTNTFGETQPSQQSLSPTLSTNQETIDTTRTTYVDTNTLPFIGTTAIDVGLEGAIAACENAIPRIFYTTPGRYTAMMPRITGDPDGDAERLYQVPEPGERLDIGDFTIAIYDAMTDEFLCQKEAEVILDPHSGARPSIEYVHAGQDGKAYVGDIPTLEFGSLLDEFGYPLDVQIYVDNTPIKGLDLALYASLYATPGVHVTSVVITDFFDRVTRWFFSEFFQDLFDSIYTGNQVMMGVKAGCNCKLVRVRTAKKDCAPPADNEGDGTQTYACDGSELQHFSSSVTDRWGDPDSQASTDSGHEIEKFTIVCSTRSGRQVSPCLNCCPNPVIIATSQAFIGGLKVRAEDATDRAMFQVSLAGSGLGKYSLKNAVASGFQSYDFTQGVTIGGNAGVGVSHAGGNASASLSASTSTSTSYKGKAYGWQSAAPVGPTFLTGWSAGTCSNSHTLSVAFNADLLAQIDYWEQFFGLTSDNAQARLASNADIIYSDVSFRCNGQTPIIGQNK